MDASPHRKVVTSLLGTLVVCLAPSSAWASEIFTLDTSIDGTKPAGTGPYLMVTATNLGVNKVELNFQTSLHGAKAFLTQTYLNLDPSLNFLELKATHISGADAGAPEFKEDQFRLGVSHAKFDVLFSFPEHQHGRLGNGFGNFTSSVYDITYTGEGTIDEQSFSFPSTSDQHQTAAFYLAAHIEGLKNGVDGAVGSSAKGGESKPLKDPRPLEPSSGVLLGGLVLGLVAWVGFCPLCASRRLSRSSVV
jgi:hypothetical protein